MARCLLRTKLPSSEKVGGNGLEALWLMQLTVLNLYSVRVLFATVPGSSSCTTMQSGMSIEVLGIPAAVAKKIQAYLIDAYCKGLAENRACDEELIATATAGPRADELRRLAGRSPRSPPSTRERPSGVTSDSGGESGMLAVASPWGGLGAGLEMSTQGGARRCKIAGWVMLKTVGWSWQRRWCELVCEPASIPGTMLLLIHPQTTAGRPADRADRLGQPLDRDAWSSGTVQTCLNLAPGRFVVDDPVAQAAAKAAAEAAAEAASQARRRLCRSGSLSPPTHPRHRRASTGTPRETLPMAELTEAAGDFSSRRRSLGGTDEGRGSDDDEPFEQLQPPTSWADPSWADPWSSLPQEISAIRTPPSITWQDDHDVMDDLGTSNAAEHSDLGSLPPAAQRRVDTKGGKPWWRRKKPASKGGKPPSVLRPSPVITPVRSPDLSRHVAPLLLPLMELPQTWPPTPPPPPPPTVHLLQLYHLRTARSHDTTPREPRRGAMGADGTAAALGHLGTGAPRTPRSASRAERSAAGTSGCPGLQLGFASGREQSDWRLALGSVSIPHSFEGYERAPPPTPLPTSPPSVPGGPLASCVPVSPFAPAQPSEQLHQMGGPLAELLIEDYFSIDSIDDRKVRAQATDLDDRRNHSQAAAAELMARLQRLSPQAADVAGAEVGALMDALQNFVFE